MKANGHSKAASSSELLQQELETILDTIVERYGHCASSISVEQHREWLPELQKKWANWMIEAGMWAKKTLQAKNLTELYAQTHGYEKPFCSLMRGELASSVFQKQRLGITTQVFARDRSCPYEYATVGFEVGYDAMPAFQWLYANWRRLLERLWEPFEPEWEDNGYTINLWSSQKSGRKEPRGRAVLPKLDFYLERSVAEYDRIFFIHIPIARVSKEQFETVVLVQFAIFDAALSLCGKHPQPDLLQKHFLTLESRLPVVRFRSRTAFARFSESQKTPEFEEQSR